MRSRSSDSKWEEEILTMSERLQLDPELMLEMSKSWYESKRLLRSNTTSCMQERREAAGNIPSSSLVSRIYPHPHACKQVGWASWDGSRDWAQEVLRDEMRVLNVGVEQLKDRHIRGNHRYTGAKLQCTHFSKE